MSPRVRTLLRVCAWTLLGANGVATTSCARKAAATPRDVPSGAADLPAAPPAPSPRSRFSVPLKYDFGGVLAVVERSVPVTIGAMDSVRQVGDDSRRHYAFLAERGPFSAYANGDVLHIVATVEYTARGFYKPIVGPTLSAGCGGGKDKPRLVVELETPIALSPDWRLLSQFTIARVEPATREPRDRCDVSILHRDVTERV